MNNLGGKLNVGGSQCWFSNVGEDLLVCPSSEQIL